MLRPKSRNRSAHVGWVVCCFVGQLTLYPSMLVVLGAGLQTEVSIQVQVSCFDCPLLGDEHAIVVLEVVAASIQATIPNFMAKFG